MYHYVRYLVACAYRVRHSDVLHPSEADLENIDQDLFDQFDGEITAQAGVQGIALDPFVRSTLAFYADQSGEPTAKESVEDAVDYYLAVKPHP